MSVSETARPLVVAVDGPGGSGKSTVARAVARQLGLSYLDTGAMYRAVAWRVLREGHNPWDRQAAAAAAADGRIELGTDAGEPSVTVDGVDVTRSIRGEAVTAAVSPVSAVPEVRARMVARQRELIAAGLHVGGIVVEGRDIGTVVAPEAPVKVFLTATARERARRRAEQTGKRPGPAAGAEIARTEQALATRDRLDSTREASPLAQAPDALVIDSTELGVAEVVDLVVKRCLRARAGQRTEP
jgi:cytidylate kinase